MADEERTGLLAEEHSEAPTPVVKPPTTYNPFGGGSSSTPTLSFPAVTTAATPAPAASPDLEALRLREADVARREAACLAREQALQRQLQQAQYRDERSATVAGDRQKNWPRCFPLIRHSIDEDIQEPTCRLVCRLSFMCFWCQAAWFLMNFIIMFGQIFLVTPSFPFTLPNFTLSIFYALFLPPLFFVFCYQPLYTGCRKHRRALLVAHLLTSGVEVFMQFFFFLGFEPYGASGVVMMAKLFGIPDARPYAMLFLVGFISCALVLAFQVTVYVMAVLMFRKMFSQATLAATSEGTGASVSGSAGGLATAATGNYGTA